MWYQYLYQHVYIAYFVMMAIISLLCINTNIYVLEYFVAYYLHEYINILYDKFKLIL